MRSQTLAATMLAVATGYFSAGANVSAFSPVLTNLGRGADPRLSSTAGVRLDAQPDHISQLCSDVGIEGKAFLLDVREVDEWTNGHLADASPCPLSAVSAGTFPMDPSTGVAIEKNAKIYVHCAKGLRAIKAAELFKNMGYSDVVPLAEGFQELAAMEVSPVIMGID